MGELLVALRMINSFDFKILFDTNNNCSVKSQLWVLIIVHRLFRSLTCVWTSLTVFAAIDFSVNEASKQARAYTNTEVEN